MQPRRDFRSQSVRIFAVLAVLFLASFAAAVGVTVAVDGVVGPSAVAEDAGVQVSTHPRPCEAPGALPADYEPRSPRFEPWEGK
jgi:hypothetical protein